MNNTRLKWVSFCFSCDFEKAKLRLDVNGKHLNTVENFKIKPESEEINVIIGYYSFDNKPLIGKMIDIHIWGRYLTEQEGLKYSSCQNFVEKQGDIVNTTSEYNITGSLIEPISVQISEFLCTLENTRITLFLHAHFLKFLDAKRACDKYFPHSMVGPFKSIYNDWKKFHSEGIENKAVIKYCWNGGRHIHWMPYEDIREAAI